MGDGADVGSAVDVSVGVDIGSCVEVGVSGSIGTWVCVVLGVSSVKEGALVCWLVLVLEAQPLTSNASKIKAEKVKHIFFSIGTIVTDQLSTHHSLLTPLVAVTRDTAVKIAYCAGGDGFPIASERSFVGC